MFFFDLAIYLVVGAAVLALGVGTVSIVSGFLRPVKPMYVEGDCRDTTLVLHGEGPRRDCE
ncbi:MAG: hypothetical protein KDB90_03730 [Planctomycetes bacterium]|nr:hypothetical protein [Planctomycetota bacterium]